MEQKINYTATKESTHKISFLQTESPRKKKHNINQDPPRNPTMSRKTATSRVFYSFANSMRKDDQHTKDASCILVKPAIFKPTLENA